MIGQLEGKVWFKSEKQLILGVNGVGYKVHVTEDTLKNLDKDAVRLWTHLAVKEDALDLYGFLEKDDLDFFHLMISISGIGPKKALAIMSIAPTSTLKKAVAKGDLAYLTKVSGIGLKNAEKIVLELRDKIVWLGKDAGSDTEDMKEDADAIETIRALGYSAQEARDALKQISPETSGVSNKVKAALKSLGK